MLFVWIREHETQSGSDDDSCFYLLLAPTLTLALVLSQTSTILSICLASAGVQIDWLQNPVMINNTNELRGYIEHNLREAKETRRERGCRGQGDIYYWVSEMAAAFHTNSSLLSNSKWCCLVILPTVWHCAHVSEFLSQGWWYLVFCFTISQYKVM